MPSAPAPLSVLVEKIGAWGCGEQLATRARIGWLWQRSRDGRLRGRIATCILAGRLPARLSVVLATILAAVLPTILTVAGAARPRLGEQWAGEG